MAARLTNWHRADVVAEVHKAGSNLSELARVNSKRESSLRMALSAPRTPSNQIIATFLGLQLHQIWPEWFTATGRRKYGAKATPRTKRRSSQKRGEQLTLTGERS